MESDIDKAYVIMQVPPRSDDPVVIGVALTEGLARSTCVELTEQANSEGGYFYVVTRFLHTLEDVDG